MTDPVAIELGNESHAWSVVVPYLLCDFSAADSGFDEVIENAKEAIELWLQKALDAGGDVPQTNSITAVQKKTGI